jgi:hypothetical protein
VPRRRGEETKMLGSILTVVCVVLAGPITVRASRDPGKAFRPSAPEFAVWSIFQGFERRNPEEYVRTMSDDFVFDSDEPAFRDAYPHGMSRADEAAFLRHLVNGGTSGNGVLRPAVTWIVSTLGPMHVTILAQDERHARALVENYLVRIGFGDGSAVELGATRNEMELELQDDAWVVRRWHETLGGEPDTGHVAAQPAAAAPLRLALVPRPERGRAMRFDLVLPAQGGRLELYDVMGRRVGDRDLEGLAPGVHAIALDGSAYPSGIYWARVRQARESVTARVTWLR